MTDNQDDPSHAVEKQSHTTTDDLKDTEINHVERDDLGYETVATELPPNYYRSVYFCGSMVACGAAFGSVSDVVLFYFV